MKRLNKTLAGLLAAATSVTMLGGCSAQSGASASAETAGADSENVLRVAMSADYAPFDCCRRMIPTARCSQPTVLI